MRTRRERERGRGCREGKPIIYLMAKHDDNDRDSFKPS